VYRKEMYFHECIIIVVEDDVGGCERTTKTHGPVCVPMRGRRCGSKTRLVNGKEYMNTVSDDELCTLWIYCVPIGCWFR
jgi:hypothetical protein